MHTEQKQPALHYHAGGFHRWNGIRYQPVSAEEIQGPIWSWLESQGITPNRRIVGEVMAATQAISCLPSDLTPPCWLNDSHQASSISPSSIIAVSDGLLDLRKRTLYGPTPSFYTHSALGTAFDPFSGPPTAWLDFLKQVYDGDQETIQTLQEFTGYLISGWTSYQKALLMVGPKRSGKGTILRIIRRLLGSETVVGPTLTSLGGPFGLEPLVHKTAAIIGDARISGRSEWSVIAERILGITGEDVITVERKFKPSWTGQLSTRFVIATNELPRLADASSALSSRFIVLIGKQSWYGREDPGLFSRLETELPGILLWALDGLDRLRKRGHFLQPAASAEAVQEIEDLGSPISAFLRTECEIGPEHVCVKAHLYERWREWCQEHGYPRPSNESHFGRDLRAALPTLRVSRPSLPSGRIQQWVGIRVLPRDHQR